MVEIWPTDQVLLAVIREWEQPFIIHVRLCATLVGVHLDSLAWATMDKVLHIPVNLRPHLLLGYLAVYFPLLHTLLDLRLHLLILHLLLLERCHMRGILCFREGFTTFLKLLKLLLFEVTFSQRVTYWPYSNLFVNFVNWFVFYIIGSFIKTSNVDADVGGYFSRLWMFVKFSSLFSLLYIRWE